VATRAPLVIINGLIASGKVTVAWERGRQFRAGGRSAAVIELDVAVEASFATTLSGPSSWTRSRPTLPGWL